MTVLYFMRYALTLSLSSSRSSHCLCVKTLIRSYMDSVFTWIKLKRKVSVHPLRYIQGPDTCHLFADS